MLNVPWDGNADYLLGSPTPPLAVEPGDHLLVECEDG